jgi:hypothetical protein
LGSSTQRERVCFNDGRIRHDGISSFSLSIVNEETAVNEPSVVSLRKGALLKVVWAGEMLLKDLGAGVNKGCCRERKSGWVKWGT